MQNVDLAPSRLRCQPEKLAQYLLLGTPMWTLMGLFFWGCTGAWAENPHEVRAPLFLAVGEQRRLRIPGLKRFSVGAPQARATWLLHEKDTLMIKGIAPGTTDLWVWKSDHQSESRSITVVATPPSPAWTSLAPILTELNELEIIPVGDQLALQGTIQTEKELQRVGHLLAKSSEKIIDRMEVTPHLVELGWQKIDSWRKKMPDPDLFRVEKLGREILITGSTEKLSQATRIDRELKILYPLARTELSSLQDGGRTVFFRIYLLEIKKDELKALGMEFRGSDFTRKEVPPERGIFPLFRSTHPGTQSALDVLGALQAQAAHGSVRLLAEPQVAVRAPGTAELFAGGEIPIKLQTRFTTNVVWKNYGLVLKLNISEIAGPRVRLQVQSEVSHLDPETGADSIPGIKINRMNTAVDAEFGRPLFLSGLIREDLRENARGLPFLSDIPVLGHLFKSEDYLNRRSELVAVLLPHATLPVHSGFASTEDYPRGMVPPPRNWIAPMDAQRLKSDPNYPWNAVQ